VAKRRVIKALKVLGGMILMLAFVAGCLAILVRYAGGWGVPYFPFTTDRGSECVNRFAGYVCSPLNLADVEYYADLDLPGGTRVVSGTYASTHDYSLESRVEVPAKSAAAALKSLNQAYGGCVADHPAPFDTSGLTKICVLANDDAVVDSGEPTGRLYSVGTGLKKDGTRVIGLSIRSR
jgi:hypothetical protein